MGNRDEERHGAGKLVKALALVRGQTVVTCPTLPSLAAQLQLFLASSTEAPFHWFVLTDETGERTRCFALSCPGLSATLCAVVAGQNGPQPSSIRQLLTAVLACAAINPSATALLSHSMSCLRWLHVPPPGLGLRLEWKLPNASQHVTFTASAAGQKPVIEPLCWDTLLILGFERTVHIWHTLLLERSVVSIPIGPAPPIGRALRRLIALFARSCCSRTTSHGSPLHLSA